MWRYGLRDSVSFAGGVAAVDGCVRGRSGVLAEWEANGRARGGREASRRRARDKRSIVLGGMTG